MVFVPILSKEALAPFAQLQQGSPCDNVCLEYLIALGLADQGRLKRIFPILVGEPEEHASLGQLYGNFFQDGGVPGCPSVVVDSIIGKATEHMARAGLEPASQLTVKDILDNVLTHQGFALTGVQNQAVDNAVREVIRAVGEERSSRRESRGSRRETSDNVASDSAPTAPASDGAKGRARSQWHPLSWLPRRR